MRRSIKLYAAFMITVMAFTLFTPLRAFGAEKSSSYYLPTKVTIYNYKKGKWVKSYSESYKYNKNRLLKSSTYNDKEIKNDKTSFKYTYYSNGKLKKAKLSGGESYVFNKNGCVTKYCLASGKTYERYKYKNSRLFKFYDGSGWFKLVYEDHPDGSIARIDVYPTYFEAEDPSLAWSEFNENGLLKKEGSEKERAGYKVKYIVSEYNYSFDRKGRVSSVVEYRKNKKETKVVFSYKNAPKTKNKTKYLYSINSCVGYLNYGMRAATSKGKIAI